MSKAARKRVNAAMRERLADARQARIEGRPRRGLSLFERKLLADLKQMNARMGNPDLLGNLLLGGR
jgi:hypothetical protein